MSANLKVLPRGKPAQMGEIVIGLERLLERAREGEFETVYIIGFAPSGSWLVKEVGKKRSRLETIGMLECLKADLVAVTETAEPSGL